VIEVFQTSHVFMNSRLLHFIQHQLNRRFQGFKQVIVIAVVGSVVGGTLGNTVPLVVTHAERTMDGHIDTTVAANAVMASGL
jgi:hypothetical protein